MVIFHSFLYVYQRVVSMNSMANVRWREEVPMLIKSILGDFHLFGALLKIWGWAGEQLKPSHSELWGSGKKGGDLPQLWQFWEDHRVFLYFSGRTWFSDDEKFWRGKTGCSSCSQAQVPDGRVVMLAAGMVDVPLTMVGWVIMINPILQFP